MYIGYEKYENLVKVGQIFQYQLYDLKNNGIRDDDGIHWQIEFFFSADWKFTYMIMGLNAPNSKYFCLYCNCPSDLRWDMDKNHENKGNNACKVLKILFVFIFNNILIFYCF